MGENDVPYDTVAVDADEQQDSKPVTTENITLSTAPVHTPNLVVSPAIQNCNGDSRKRKRTTAEDDIVETTLQSLRDSKQVDRWNRFGQYIAETFRSLDQPRQKDLEYKILALLLDNIGSR